MSAVLSLNTWTSSSGKQSRLPTGAGSTCNARNTQQACCPGQLKQRRPLPASSAYATSVNANGVGPRFQHVDLDWIERRDTWSGASKAPVSPFPAVSPMQGHLDHVIQKQITQCSTTSQLARLVRAKAGSLSPTTTTCALMQLAGLAPHRSHRPLNSDTSAGSESDASTGQVAKAGRGMLQRSEEAVGTELAQELLQLLERDLSQLQAWHVCNSIHALGSLRLPPGSDDLANSINSLLEAAKPDMLLSQPRHLSRLGIGLLTLHHVPSRSWAAEYAKVLQAKLPLMCPEQLSSLPPALAHMQHTPSPFWLAAYESLSTSSLPLWDLHQLGSVCAALRQFGAKPGAAWLAAANAALHAALLQIVESSSTGADSAPDRGSSGGSSGDALLLAAGRDTTSSSSSSSSEFGANSSSSSGSVNGANSKSKEALMTSREGSSSVDLDVLDVSSRRSSGRNTDAMINGGSAVKSGGRSGNVARVSSVARKVVQALHGLVGLGSQPPPATMRLLLSILELRARQLRSFEDVQLFGALRALQHTPEKLWMERVLHRISARLRHYSSIELLLLLEHVGSLRFLPPRGWILGFISVTQPNLHSYSPAAVASTLGVFAMWRLQPPPGYLWTLMQLFRVQAPEASLGDIAKVLSSLRRLSVLLPTRLLATVLIEAGQARVAPPQRDPAGSSRSSSGTKSAEWKTAVASQAASDLADVCYSLHRTARSAGQPSWGPRVLPWLAGGSADAAVSPQDSAGSYPSLGALSSIDDMAGVGRGRGRRGRGIAPFSGDGLQSVGGRSGSDRPRQALFAGLLDTPAGTGSIVDRQLGTSGGGQSHRNDAAVSISVQDSGNSSSSHSRSMGDFNSEGGSDVVSGRFAGNSRDTAAGSTSSITSSDSSSSDSSSFNGSSDDIVMSSSSTSLSTGGGRDVVAGGGTAASGEADEVDVWDRFEWGMDVSVWPGAKAVVDALSGQLHHLGPDRLYLSIVGLAYVRFYPGREFLESHVAAASRHLSSLSIAEKQLMSRAYLRLKESKGLARQLRFKLEEQETLPSVVVPGGVEVN